MFWGPLQMINDRRTLIHHWDRLRKPSFHIAYSTTDSSTISTGTHTSNFEPLQQTFWALSKMTNSLYSLSTIHWYYGKEQEKLWFRFYIRDASTFPWWWIGTSITEWCHNSSSLQMVIIVSLLDTLVIETCLICAHHDKGACTVTCFLLWYV